MPLATSTQQPPDSTMPPNDTANTADTTSKKPAGTPPTTGDYVAIWWSGDRKFYCGTLRDPTGPSSFTIKYDDSDEEELDLTKETWCYAPPTKADNTAARRAHRPRSARSSRRPSLPPPGTARNASGSDSLPAAAAASQLSVPQSVAASAYPSSPAPDKGRKRSASNALHVPLQLQISRKLSAPDVLPASTEASAAATAAAAVAASSAEQGPSHEQHQVSVQPSNSDQQAQEQPPARVEKRARTSLRLSTPHTKEEPEKRQEQHEKSAEPTTDIPPRGGNDRKPRPDHPSSVPTTPRRASSRTRTARAASADGGEGDVRSDAHNASKEGNKGASASGSKSDKGGSSKGGRDTPADQTAGIAGGTKRGRSGGGGNNAEGAIAEHGEEDGNSSAPITHFPIVDERLVEMVNRRLCPMERDVRALASTISTLASASESRHATTCAAIDALRKQVDAANDAMRALRDFNGNRVEGASRDANALLADVRDEVRSAREETRAASNAMLEALRAQPSAAVAAAAAAEAVETVAAGRGSSGNGNGAGSGGGVAARASLPVVRALARSPVGRTASSGRISSPRPTAVAAQRSGGGARGRVRPSSSNSKGAEGGGPGSSSGAALDEREARDRVQGEGPPRVASKEKRRSSGDVKGRAVMGGVKISTATKAAKVSAKATAKAKSEMVEANVTAREIEDGVGKSCAVKSATVRASGEQHRNPAVGSTGTVGQSGTTAVAPRASASCGTAAVSTPVGTMLRNVDEGYSMRVCNLVARQVTVCLLETPHENAEGVHLDMWAKRTSAKIYDHVSERLSQFSSYAQAYQTLLTSLGHDSVELLWFKTPFNHTVLMRARRNYAPWDPPPSDEEWRSERILLREVAISYQKVAGQYAPRAGDSELTVAIDLADKTLAKYKADGYFPAANDADARSAPQANGAADRDMPSSRRDTRPSS